MRMNSFYLPREPPIIALANRLTKFEEKEKAGKFEWQPINKIFA